jgi:hypothetical protein
VAQDHLSIRSQRVRELREMLANRADELHPMFTSLVVRMTEVMNDMDRTVDECRVLHGGHNKLVK